MISIKKLATVGAAAGLLLASAMPVLASHWSNDVDIDQDNDAYVENLVEALSNTGENYIGDGDGLVNTIDTGDATTAVAISNKVNKNVAKVEDACGCFDDVDIDQDNDAYVGNGVFAVSNTGANSISGGLVNTILTGNAVTATSISNVVNKNVAIVDGD